MHTHGERLDRKGYLNERISTEGSTIIKINSAVRCVQNQTVKLNLYGAKVPAGFPSPADDYLEGVIDLNELLVKHPSSTMLVRASGHSMINAGIFDNDILVVDRSLKPIHGKIVIAVIDSETTVKRLQIINGTLTLISENPDYNDIQLKEGNEFSIWGVVTCVLHSL